VQFEAADIAADEHRCEGAAFVGARHAVPGKSAWRCFAIRKSRTLAGSVLVLILRADKSQPRNNADGKFEVYRTGPACRAGRHSMLCPYGDRLLPTGAS
jgi:hypothetical protein